MEIFAINLKARSRRATLNGRDYLVAPLTLIVPGVLNGSKGALYYPPEEISRDPTIWNHVPIVVYHPTRNGQHVSARDPDILDKQGIGVVMRSKAGSKLTAEGWFDVESTRRVDKRVLNALEAGDRIELSTGLFTENEVAAGTFNGKPYDMIARNYRPDHLAILPDQVGACSVNDGCGVMVNKRACSCGSTCELCVVANEDPAQTKKKKQLLKTWQPVKNCGYDGPMEAMAIDDGSLLSTDAKVRSAYREMYPPQYNQNTGGMLDRPTVVSVFEDHLICREDGDLRRHSWSLDDAGAVVIDDGFETVERVTKYEPISA